MRWTEAHPEAPRLARAAFVIEQTLGHVTHARNLQAAAEQTALVQPTWLPIAFPPRRVERLVPLLRSNWSVRASWRARRALAGATQRFDVLYFHTQVTSLFSTGLMRSIPSVVSLDATPINYDSVGAGYGHRAATTSFADRQAYRLNRNAFHAASALVVWSSWARRSLVNDYGVDDERIHVLAPGAAEAYFALGERRLNREQPAGSPVRVLFVGGDFQRKGGELLLEALADLPACELDVVTQSAVEPRANVRVHRGLQANSPDLLRLFEAADIFVLPTYAECLAVVLMEATAAALPVITTDVGALGEAVVPGETGALLPPGDGRALREAIQSLAGDPARRERQGRAGQALARATFDAKHNNETLLHLLADTAARGASGVRTLAA